MASTVRDLARVRAAPGISHAPGTRTTWMAETSSSAAPEAVECSLQQAVCNDGVPTGVMMANASLRPRDCPHGGNNAVIGVVGLPEADLKSAREAEGKESGVPVGRLDGCERRVC